MTGKRSVLLSLVLVSSALLAATQEPGRPHPNDSATFTGQIKPVLYVSDVEKSAPFYRDVLGFDFDGFAEIRGEPYYAEMVAGGTKFGLHEPVSDGDDAMVGRARLYFRIVDLEAQRARVEARGGRPGEVKKTGWMDFFVVRDPDGNRIVFAVTDPERHRSDPWRASADKSANDQGHP